MTAPPKEAKYLDRPLVVGCSTGPKPHPSMLADWTRTQLRNLRTSPIKCVNLDSSSHADVSLSVHFLISLVFIGYLMLMKRGRDLMIDSLCVLEFEFGRYCGSTPPIITSQTMTPNVVTSVGWQRLYSGDI